MSSFHCARTSCTSTASRGKTMEKSQMRPASPSARWWSPGASSCTWPIQAAASPAWTSSGRPSPNVSLLFREGMAAPRNAFRTARLGSDTSREPRTFLGHLHGDDVRLLTHEFGLHNLSIRSHSRIRPLTSNDRASAGRSAASESCRDNSESGARRSPGCAAIQRYFGYMRRIPLPTAR